MVRLGSTPVLDFGTFSVKAGFAGESYPLWIFTQEQFQPSTWPIVRGRIEDWTTFSEILEMVWSKLKVDPSEEEVIVVEHLESSSEQISKLEKTMFEKFRVKYLTMFFSSLCACKAAGVSTGLVVDVGHGVTRVSAVIDSDTMKEITLDTGGQDADESLLNSLSCKYPDMDLSIYVREIKERHCFATLSPKEEAVAKAENHEMLRRTYELPDKTDIHLTHERASCIEPIFGTPKDSKATLAKSIKQLIESFPEFSNQLAANIIICGGLSEIRNFNYRLLSELYMCKAGKVIRVYCPPERTHLSWIGAASIYFDDEYVDVGMSLEQYERKHRPRNEE